MCEKEPKRRSCTECPQYDGMKCTATDFTLGDRDEVLQQEHRRGFICLDTGEAELKGDAVLQWTAEQERLSQEKGYKSCEEMWAAEDKQVKYGLRIDEDNEHLEPVLHVSNDPGPVKLTFQYEENAKSVDDTMYHPNQPENQKWYTVEARANIGVDLDLLREHNPNIRVIRASELEKSATTDCIADMLHKGEGGPLTSVFTGSKMPDGIIHMVDCNPAHAQFQYRPEALPKYAGSPSSECPSRRDGPPQKGKITENRHLHNTLRCALIRNPEAHCGNCKKSHTEGDRLVCDKWGLQDILMPYRPCEKWALEPLKVRAEEQQIHYAEGSGLQYVKNPPPLFRDPNGFWEPVRPRSCTNCKLYNDPICMKMATHIGTRQEILAKEEENGFLCFAADQMRRDE